MARWTDGVRRDVLANGLTLLVQADHSAPVAAVVTHVKAGFFDEPDHWVGVSHVLEHMFFKGTPTREAGHIAQDTRAVGGYLNAGTSYDYTTYYVVLPARSLETALDIQADALQHSVIDADELARELQVIIQEAKRKRDSPGALTTETLFEVMYDRHRMRRWRIGHEDHLARLTRDDIVGYYRSRYVPRNTIVSLVGDFDPDATLAMARERYASWEDRDPAVDPSPDEPPRHGPRARVFRGDVAQAHLALGWRTVPPLHEDTPALELGAAVLSMGRGSWLYRALREPGLVSAVSAYAFDPTELGLFGIGAECDPPQAREVIAGMGESLQRLVEHGPGAEDLERARTLVLTRWARQLESMDGRASALASSEALDSYAVLDRELARLMETTAGQVRDACRRYLTPDTVSAALYYPGGTGEDLSADDIARLLAPEATAGVTDEEPDVAIRSFPAVSVSPARHDGATVVTLPGVDLVLWPKAGVPTVTLGVSWSRTPDPSLDQAGLTALAVRSALRGIAGHGAAGVAQAFERRGGTVRTQLTGDRAGFACTVLARETVSAAGLVRRLLEEAALDDDEVRRERDVMIEEARQRTDDMFRYPFQLAFGAAFQDTGYGVPLMGTPASLETFDGAQAREAYGRLLDGARPVVVCVGEFDPPDLAGALAGVFQDYPGGPAAREAVDASRPARGAAPRIEARDRAQSALALVYPGPGRTEDDRFAANVWAAVAGGLGGRLFETLRSQRSLAYTVLASSWQRRSAGALVSYIATSPEREDEAREGLLEELERFADTLVSEDERSRAINYVIGQRQVARQSSAAIVEEVTEAWLVGNGLDDLAAAEEHYRAVTSERIRTVCAAYLRRDLAVEGTVRGEGAPPG